MADTIKTNLEDLKSYSLDLTVGHGQVAARYRGRTSGPASPEEAAKLLRVSGQVQIQEPVSKPDVEETGPKEGLVAPAFRAVTFEGKMVDLNALRGKKVWLIFYRYATCPLCNYHLKLVSDRYDALKRSGTEVIAVFDSPVPQFFQPGNQVRALFPIVSDPERKLYKLYDTRSNVLGIFRPSVVLGFAQAMLNGQKQGRPEGEVGQLPSHFLIGESGRIETVFHGTGAFDHIPWVKVGLFTKLSSSELRPPRL